MTSKRWGALYALCFAVALGWGATGLVEGGCDWHNDGQRSACGVPDGYGWYAAVFIVAALSFPPLCWTVIRTDDWRPSLGISVGAAIALAITLFTGVTRGFLILAAVEAAIAVGVPLILRRVGRTKARAKKMSRTSTPT
ncbi:hypothetical protein EDD90_0054 [Streptomyces sp. Ag109_O5-1]|uniref:hypothetical protein n=1 Tax=Streptomyces sp. Ag109_O5-1 TaxID=1938851 RepID=UPI000F50CC9E|nr:hypothetical protein [Streptomyces sp. Ag109_O5-1]RPE37241.1 hypothetical protein EDD90_0054 [Streptomyces sp. Ag109_O5-1]